MSNFWMWKFRIVVSILAEKTMHGCMTVMSILDFVPRSTLLRAPVHIEILERIKKRTITILFLPYHFPIVTIRIGLCLIQSPFSILLEYIQGPTTEVNVHQAKVFINKF